MSKFNAATDIPDLAGKTIVVTGGNAGLGAETVKSIAAHNPANLFLCARTATKAEAFITELRKQHPNTTTKPINLDLASLESVKAAAKQINESCEKIDILILNAGVSALAPTLTKDGYEIQFGTNHVGHALFTQLLMSKVLTASKDGGDARVVVVASQASQGKVPMTGLPLDEMKTTLPNLATMTRYSYSKMANIYFAQRLAKEYPQITAAAIHPGVVFTEIWGKTTAVPAFLGRVAGVLVRVLGKSVEDGAKNQLWAAFNKGVQSGKYYDPVGKLVEGTPATRNEESRDKLWDWTNKELAAHGAPGWPA